MKPPVYALAANHSLVSQRRVGRDNNSSMVVHKAAASKFEVLIQFPFWLRFPHFLFSFSLLRAFKQKETAWHWWRGIDSFVERCVINGSRYDAYEDSNG